MAMTPEAENNFLKLLFQNVAWANIGDASGLQPSGAAGDIWLSLHTASPAGQNSQTQSEATYTSYARINVPRTASDWTVTANAATLAAIQSFPTSTGSSNVVTHCGLGTASSGTGHLFAVGAISPSITVTTGITPQADTSTTFTAT